MCLMDFQGEVLKAHWNPDFSLVSHMRIFRKEGVGGNKIAKSQSAL